MLLECDNIRTFTCELVVRQSDVAKIWV